MKKLLLILLCLPVIGFGQNVNIPDVNFKAYLVGNNLINTNGDTEIQVSEATAFNGAILCNSLNIFDLTGIEVFTALTFLDCYDNQLTSLDVTANTALNFFICGENQLTSLDVTANTALIFFNCPYNQLTSLDVSQNAILIHLDCVSNQLTTLDVSNNINLTDIYCAYNNLTVIDVSNNTSLTKLWCAGNQLIYLNVKNGNNYNFYDYNMYSFNCENNPLLDCIEVDDAAWSTANWTHIDSQHYFSTNCSGTSIQENTRIKELLKVTGLFGRETNQTNQPIFYIYDDGTVEKKITIN